MNTLKIISGFLLLPFFLIAQYTGGSGDGFAVWTSQNDISLPVELISYKQIITSSGIELKWETASEIDNIGFVIKRKSNSLPFEIISSYRDNNSLAGMGNSSVGKIYQYTDTQVNESNSYWYQVLSISISGKEKIVFQTAEINFNPSKLPLVFEIQQNYPNPFNPKTNIVFATSGTAHVKVSVFNILGQLVSVLTDREYEKGHHELVFEPENFHASNIYICTIESAGIIKKFKMIYAK